MRPHLCCTVPDCGRSRATQDPRLPLCGLHLTALERHCKGKHRLAGVRLARREIDRLTAARLDRTGDQVEPRAFPTARASRPRRKPRTRCVSP